MKHFWPWFFAFLITVFITVGLWRPDLMETALIALGQAFVALFVLLVVGLLIAGGLAVWAWVRRTRIAGLRQKDGAFPIQRVKLRNGAVLYYDPNQTVSAGTIIDPQYGMIEIAPAAGWDVQTAVRLAVERTRQLQAMYPGDEAQRWTHGKYPRISAIPKSASPPVVNATPQLPAPAVQLLTVEQALQRRGTAWAVGQNRETGALAEFSLASHVHVGIVGSTGTGKTSSVGMLLALYALRAGYHVIIIDPDGGIDWGALRGHAEWYPSDRTTFADQVAALHTEYQIRATATDAPPIWIVFEEYGDLIHQLRLVSRSQADAVDAMLDAILRRGRKRNMHCCFIDQYPEHWSQQIVSGIKFRAVFKLGPHQGAKVEEYKASSLPDTGRFLVAGKEYDAWHVKADLPRLLPPPRTFVRVLEKPVHEPVHVNVHEAVHSPFMGRSHEVAPPSPVFMNGVNGDVGEDDSTRWQPLIDEWFRTHPEALTGPPAGITDIARRMSLADTGSLAAAANYKSIAHKLFHERRNNAAR